MYQYIVKQAGDENKEIYKLACITLIILQSSQNHLGMYQYSKLGR